jgi:nicotinamide phosphoribosyltransferase
MSKASKKGRLGLYNGENGFITLREGMPNREDLLIPVFENGELLKEFTFKEIRGNLK